MSKNRSAATEKPEGCFAKGACELKLYYTKYKKSVDRKCCSVYNLLSVIQNNSLRFRLIGGVTKCLFVQKINLPKVEEIEEEQTGKCLLRL